MPQLDLPQLDQYQGLQTEDPKWGSSPSRSVQTARFHDVGGHEVVGHEVVQHQLELTPREAGVAEEKRIFLFYSTAPARVTVTAVF